MTGPLVIAHRGDSSVAPENTLPALEAAVRGGAHLLEIDLQLTADGVGAVIHDATVDRTTDGTGPVAGLLARELVHLDAGAWFAPAFAGTRLPVLADVLDLLRGHTTVGLLLELKGSWPREATARVVDEIAAAGLTDRVLTQSFSVDMLLTLRDLAPDLPRGLLASELDGSTLATCADLGVVACNVSAAHVVAEPGSLRAIHDAGLRCHVWTPNEPAQWATLVDAGVDGIITDRPDRLVGWLSAR